MPKQARPTAPTESTVRRRHSWVRRSRVFWKGASGSYWVESYTTTFEQQRPVEGSAFARSGGSVASQGIGFLEDTRRNSFRNVLPPPPLSFTIHSSTYILVVAFPEDRPKQSNRTSGKLPQLSRAPQDSSSLRDFVGPLPPPPQPSSHDEPSGSVAILPNVHSGLATSGLLDAQQFASESDSRPALNTQTRDSVFESYDAPRLLLAAADRVLDGPSAESSYSELLPDRAMNAEGHTQLGSISALGISELSASRFASQRSAIDEVLRNLHNVDELVRGSTERPLSDFEWATDYALIVEDLTASRSRAAEEPSDIDSTSALEGGMILLSPTGDANDGVYEVPAAGEITAQLKLPTGVSTASRAFQSYRVAVEVGLSKGSAKATAHDERQAEKSTEQARSSLTARPSQQQTAVLIGTGVALGAVQWNKKRRTRDQKVLPPHDGRLI